MGPSWRIPGVGCGAGDDAPIKYRKKQRGVRVVASDPKNIQICYGACFLKII